MEKSIGTCKYCGEKIRVGNKYVWLDGYMHHRDCLEEITVEEWLELLGEAILEADYSDLDEEWEAM